MEVLLSPEASRMRLRKLTTAWLEQKAWQQMLEQSTKWLPSETGGILMGYWSGSGSEVIITDVIGPGRAAHHSRTHFEPDYAFQEQEVERIYRASDGSDTYLGDWHSHGELTAKLSKRDRRTHGRMASDPASRSPRALMAILGNGPTWNLRLWEYRKLPLSAITNRWASIECRIRIWNLSRENKL